MELYVDAIMELRKFYRMRSVIHDGFASRTKKLKIVVGLYNAQR
jgi:hypothetical protein